MSDNDEISFSTIIASTIHDVKNSLNIVLNSLDEVVQAAGDALPTEQVGKLQHEARRVNNNLVKLLTLYKMENKGLAANIDEYPVREFLEETLISEQPTLSARNIKLTVACDDGLIGYFDRELIAGVLGNAINNAIRYAKSAVCISAEERDAYLALSVNDDGSGFPEGMLNQSGPQGHGVSFSSGNTGLGLYFSAKVAEMHKNKNKHGSIELSNGHALGGGCFTIILP